MIVDEKRPVKVCPRCNYVDTDGRRVCLACRGSLMGVEETDVAHVVAQRTTALAMADAAPSVPWGPALRTLLDERDREPETEPADDDAPRPPVATAAPTEPDPELTRQQLSRLYDARTAAPVLVEAEAPRAGADASPPTPSAPPRSATRTRTSRAEPSRGAADARVREVRRNRQRAALVVVALVLGYVGLRVVRHAMDDDSAAAVRDPSTAVNALPWRDEAYGELTVRVPTTPDPRTVDAASGYTRFDRYDLPDVLITITSRAPVPGLATEAGLRTYAAQTAQLGGGGLANGFARDLTFGTAFSATLDVPDGVGYLYVVSTPTEVLEIRADASSTETGRPTRIFEQIIRSVSPR